MFIWCQTGWPSLTAVPVWDHLLPRPATSFPPRMDHLFSVDHLFPPYIEIWDHLRFSVGDHPGAKAFVRFAVFYHYLPVLPATDETRASAFTCHFNHKVAHTTQYKGIYSIYGIYICALGTNSNQLPRGG